MVEYNEVNVTGGRDHRLLTVLAQHMNFQFVYIEAPGRTQGSLRTPYENGDANDSFTGGIGMLQSGVSTTLPCQSICLFHYSSLPSWRTSF